MWGFLICKGAFSSPFFLSAELASAATTAVVAVVVTASAAVVVTASAAGEGQEDEDEEDDPGAVAAAKTRVTHNNVSFEMYLNRFICASYSIL